MWNRKTIVFPAVVKLREISMENKVSGKTGEYHFLNPILLKIIFTVQNRYEDRRNYKIEYKKSDSFFKAFG